MSKQDAIYERFSSNVAYLDKEIEKSNELFIKDYNEIFSYASPYDVDGNMTVEMIEGQFTVNCSKSQLDSLYSMAKSRLNYINQCIDEIDNTIKGIPSNKEYTDEEIKEFIERASAINSARYRNRGTGYKLRTVTSQNTRTNSSSLPVRIVEEGRKLIGTPYVWGGSDLNIHKGLDCSGFVCYAANKAGYSMNRETTKTLINMGTEVSRDELQIGDLIFPSSSHVGFYSGNGKFLHSPKPGDYVKEVDIYAFWRARRIFPGVGGDSTSMSSGSSSSVGSGDYYGPGNPVEWIERTPDPEVTKIIVPQGANSWSLIASYLSISEDTLKKLNPGIKTLYAGTTLYIPTSSVTQARELAAKAKSQATKTSRQLDNTVSLLSDTITLSAKAVTSKTTATTTKSTVKEDKTPFQTILNNEDYIKTYDLKEHQHKQRAKLEIQYDGKVRRIQTLISPIAYSETYGNAINVTKTAGGWFVSRHGENLPQLNINGYLLDTKYAPEKHAFMEEFKKYMTDTVNSTTGDYENNAIIKITMEGVEYQGHVTSITFNKDANRPALYSFSMSFTCIYYKNIRDVQGAISSLNSSKSRSSSNSLYLADGIASIITG